jgi:cellulose synthase/poly-beta-1,6-N-acetylglucosamine synthase-like glycosyltransferase
MEWAFWISAAVVLYTFVLYPASMILIGILSPRRRVSIQPFTPSLAIIIAACNEERHIADRLTQLLDSDYPAPLREVFVVTDNGSTDRTAEIARSFAARGVRHLHSPIPGKNACLDFAVAATNADVLVFKDASGLFAPDALLRLAAPFHDPKVGCVSGAVVFSKNGRLGEINRNYWQWERLLQRGMQRLGYLPVVPGGIHAMRRSIYRPVNNAITRDLVDTVEAIVQGYTVIKDDEAISFELPWDGAADVYRSRLRITQRSWAGILHNLSELWRARRWDCLVHLLSHKVLRYLVFASLLICFVTSGFLATDSRFFTAILAVQTIAYFVCLLALLAARSGLLIPCATFFGFVFLNVVAMFDGTIRFFAGRRVAAWKS